MAILPAGEAGSVNYLDADAPIPMPLGGEGWTAEEQQQVQDLLAAWRSPLYYPQCS